MNKAIAIFLGLLMTLSFVACSTGIGTEVETKTTETDTSTAPQSAENESISGDSENTGIQVDEGLLNVTITLPASYLESVEGFDPDTYTQEQGFKKTVVNEDGSISITMSKSRHSELMAEIGGTVDQSFNEMIKAEDTPYIEGINSDSGYTKVIVDVEKAGYENALLEMTPFTIGFLAMMYQKYDGAELHCEVIIRDVNTGDILKSVIYPDAMN